MKKKINFLLISKRLRFIGTFFNFIMFFIPFLPCVQLISGATKRNYGPAYSFIFGGKISSTNISYSAKGISPIFLISFLLILFAFLTLIYSFFAQNKKNTNISSILTFSSSITIFLSSIFVLCSHKSIANVLADSLTSEHSDSVSKTVYNNSTLLFGTYGLSIAGFITSLILFASLLFDGSFDRVRKHLGLI